jgi:MFS family permease
MLAATLGGTLSLLLPEPALSQWGWRIPLLIGCLIVPFLFILRRTLMETEAFRARTHHPSAAELLRSIAANWRLVLVGTMMVVMTTVSFYMITAYTPTFGSRELNLAATDVMIVTLCVGASNFFWLPVVGALSDRIGRRPILIGCTVLALLTAYPAMAWLVASPSFAHLLAVELWLSFLYGSYNGAMVVALTEIMPLDVRTSGFSLAYSFATIIGGVSPAISTALIHTTGNRAMPGVWLSLAAALGLGAALLLGTGRRGLGARPEWGEEAHKKA